MYELNITLDLLFSGQNMLDIKGLGEFALPMFLLYQLLFQPALSLIRKTQSLLVEIIRPEKSRSRAQPLRSDI